MKSICGDLHDMNVIVFRGLLDMCQLHLKAVGQTHNWKIMTLQNLATLDLLRHVAKNLDQHE